MCGGVGTATFEAAGATQGRIRRRILMADAKQTVLIVDDDRAILTLLARVLETGYTVIEAADGRRR